MDGWLSGQKGWLLEQDGWMVVRAKGLVVRARWMVVYLLKGMFVRARLMDGCVFAKRDSYVLILKQLMVDRAIRIVVC